MRRVPWLPMVLAAALVALNELAPYLVFAAPSAGSTYLSFPAATAAVVVGGTALLVEDRERVRYLSDVVSVGLVAALDSHVDPHPVRFGQGTSMETDWSWFAALARRFDRRRNRALTHPATSDSSADREGTTRARRLRVSVIRGLLEGRTAFASTEVSAYGELPRERQAR